MGLCSVVRSSFSQHTGTCTAAYVQCYCRSTVAHFLLLLLLLLAALCLLLLLPRCHVVPMPLLLLITRPLLVLLSLTMHVLLRGVAVICASTLTRP